ncbi:MAG: creatininase family protein [Chloroflexi bacterium]|nr:creatininase family protein [Chloroflexota bacterium]
MSIPHAEQLTGEEFRQALQQSRIAILPIGAIEFHGPHLPTGTDNFLAMKMAEEVAKRTGGVLLPLLPYGQVWGLEHFPGSLNVPNETLTALLFEIGVSLHRQGAVIFAIINGHLGNMTAIQAAARRLFSIEGFITYAFSYPGLAEAASRICASRPLPGGYFHADEIETSLLLYAQPELVHMERAIRDEPQLPPDFGSRQVRWEEITKTGVLGDATVATREKGEALLQALVSRVVEILEYGRSRYLAK